MPYGGRAPAAFQDVTAPTISCTSDTDSNGEWEIDAMYFQETERGLAFTLRVKHKESYLDVVLTRATP